MGVGKSKYDQQKEEEEYFYQSRGVRRHFDKNENQRSIYNEQGTSNGDSFNDSYEFTTDERAFITELYNKDAQGGGDRNRKQDEKQQEKRLAQFKRAQELREMYISRLEQMEQTRRESNERRFPVARLERKQKTNRDFRGRFL